MSCALILLTWLYGWDSMVDIDINPSSMGPIFGVVDRTDPWGPEMDPPLLCRSYLVVVPSYDMSCAPDSLNWALWVRFHGRYWYQSFIDGSNIWGVDRTDPWGPEMDHSAIGPQLFGSSAVVWYVMCPDSLNWALWVRFHGRYWYQSFIDGSNIWGVDRTDPWGPEMDHPALGRSYLVVVPSVWYVMCPDSLNWALWVRFHGRYWYQSFIDGSNIWGVDRTDPWGPEMDHPAIGPQLFGSSAVVMICHVPWFS